MNVAITRSKSSLFIFGHAPTLARGDKVWKDIIDDARARSCFVELVSVHSITRQFRVLTPVLARCVLLLGRCGELRSGN